MQIVKNFRLNLLLVLVATACLIGCDGKAANDAELMKKANDSNMKKVASAYQMYASRHAYTGPKSKDVLVEFLKTNQTIDRNLKLVGIDLNTLDDIFVSDNDGEEFVIRWGQFMNPDETRAKEPFIFEKVGVDGMRLVMISNRKILEVTDDKKYQKLLKGKVGKEDAKSEAEMEQEAEEAAL
jgi:hypothetical protein